MHLTGLWPATLSIVSAPRLDGRSYAKKWLSYLPILTANVELLIANVEVLTARMRVLTSSVNIPTVFVGLLEK